MLTQLETVLAVTLLERRRNGSFPTPLGSVLLPRVARLFAHIQSALRDPVVGASLSGRETTKSVENKITDTHIRSLTAIAECGSFAAAARRLNISQPSLHRSARDLERVVRRSLYQRIARGLAPTDHASELARRLKVALRELDYGIEEIRAAQGVFTSRITVGNIPHSGTHLLSTTITRFLAFIRAHLFTSSMAPMRGCSMRCGPGISTCCSGYSGVRPGQPTSNKNFCSQILTPFSSVESIRSPAFEG
jgi:LysR family transcriptional regulator, regulator for genes of the gallate degradation pathway